MIKLKTLILEAMTPYQAEQIFARYGIPNALSMSKSDLSGIYKKLSMKHHPDKGGKTNDMQYINSAYDVLKKTPQQSKEYSQQQRQQQKQQQQSQQRYQQAQNWPSKNDVNQFDKMTPDARRAWYNRLNPQWKSAWDKVYGLGAGSGWEKYNQANNINPQPTQQNSFNFNNQQNPFNMANNPFWGKNPFIFGQQA